jgi:MFS transporter, PAT family, solute carrier family 33 (acetyl-CoA transportor), member 1
MSALRNESPSEDLPNLRYRSHNANVEVTAGQTDMSPLPPFPKKAVSSSLDSIRILPRAPAGTSSETEEVELSLLSGEERASARLDGDVQTHVHAVTTTAMSSKDRKAMTLLIILCQLLHISCFPSS